MRLLVFPILICAVAPSLGFGQAPVPRLMPMPAKLGPVTGSFAIDQSFTVAATGASDPRLEKALDRLIARVERRTGLPLIERSQPDPAKASMLVRCERSGPPIQKLGEEESYTLEVTPGQIRLTAPNALGVLRGMETFVQLIDVGPAGFSVPAISIEDAPRFPWRGLHMDVSRHWMPLSVVLRNLDGMAAVKLNVFHWHLSDDQGFRIESKRYPKLQELGSDGHFYTQEQVREVIAYARDRGIRVVPEFDVPAHSSSWLTGYPELGSASGPYEIGRHWGIFEPTMDPAREAVYTFLDNFIGEMAHLFPDEYFHIGGDEVNGKEWDRNPQIQAFLKQHKLADNHALQAYFNRRIQAIVKKHGKRMEGWDEILDPELPKDIVIQSWRGQKSLADAARLGYDGLLSAPYYLDAMKTAADHYLADPLDKESAGLTPEEQKHILGGEVCTWSEFLTPENIDSRIWPRTAAIAERFWSPREVRDVPSMYDRLAAVNQQLRFVGLLQETGPRTMLMRIGGKEGFAALETLAAVVTPVRLGQRQRARKYTQQTPLNRLPDAAQPESETARRFALLVDDALAGKGDRAAVRRWLSLWRDNDGRLRPCMESDYLLQELAPISASLSAVASAGLQALDGIASGQMESEDWLAVQRNLLESARQPKNELSIAIIPAVQKLVEAAAAGH